VEDTKEEEPLTRTNEQDWEFRDRLFIIQLLLDSLTEKLQAIATTFQHLVKKAHWSIEVQTIHSLLPNYTLEFEIIFAKKNFDTLIEHHCWNHTIELLLGLQPKLFKVYFLSSIEQKKLDTFLKENLYTRCIRHFKSPIVALVFFIKKKNSSFCLV